jgi:hypothetical protein
MFIAKYIHPRTKSSYTAEHLWEARSKRTGFLATQFDEYIKSRLSWCLGEASGICAVIFYEGSNSDT